LAAGYTDRTKQRFEEEEDDKAMRVKALEEMMKLQQIDLPTFEKLRDEIVGGDVGSVHLVKGLDYKLLERVRRGEDVLNGNVKDGEEDEQADSDIEDEFKQLEDREVASVTKEKTVKKGEMAPPSLVPGMKRSRDQILAEMKAARLAAKEKAGPSLGLKFKKVGAPRIESRIERDGKGREVLITVDEHGNEKRKVRRVQVESEVEKGHGLLMPDKDVAPLGMEVPEIPKAPEVEEDDIDIFDDVGDDYDPLAGIGDDDDSDEEDGEVAERKSLVKEAEKLPTAEEASATLAMPPPPKSNMLAASRNYFGETTSTTSTPSAGSKAMSDPTILAALKKASTIAPTPSSQTGEEKARDEKRKRMLQQDDRDAQDLDMGFGSSRFEDEADFGDEKVKLSEWKSGKGGDDEDGDDGDGKGKPKRKRGGKKRKGDKNSAADVLRVMEQRKQA
jgi:hypothetical protein